MKPNKDGEIWDEVFHAGTHVDSNGVARTFTEADIESMAASYDPANHEAPIVVGHPRDNAPAFGWVDQAKAAGGRLLLRYKQLAPEFVEWVKNGRYKKRSVAFYPDFSIRHVGFLGAQPPAIKGLPDVAFAESDEIITIEYSENAVRRLLQGVREFFIDKFGLEAADRAIPTYELELVGDEPSEKLTYKEGGGMTKSQREIELEQQLAAEQTKNQELSRQYSEATGKVTTLETENTQLKAAATQREADARRSAHLQFAEGLITDGKLAPANKHLVIAFMEGLDRVGELEYAEGDVTVKKNGVEQFKAFMEGLPSVVQFGEHASRDKGGDPQSGTAGERLERATREKMAADQSKSYGMAFAEAQRENPELAREYEQELRG